MVFFFPCPSFNVLVHQVQCMLINVFQPIRRSLSFYCLYSFSPSLKRFRSQMAFMSFGIFNKHIYFGTVCYLTIGLFAAKPTSRVSEIIREKAWHMRWQFDCTENSRLRVVIIYCMLVAISTVGSFLSSYNGNNFMRRRSSWENEELRTWRIRAFVTVLSKDNVKEYNNTGQEKNSFSIRKFHLLPI